VTPDPPAPGAVGAGGPSAVHLGIVVVNFGSSDLIARNVAGIDRARVAPSTVVVVDNYSSATERRSITDLARLHGWELVTTDANRGFGAGVNRGVTRAIGLGCTHLLLLNPDVSIDAESLTRLVRFGLDHPEILVSPRLVQPDGSAWFIHGRLDRRTGLTRSIREGEQEGPDRWLTGACLLIERKTWELLGGFDERFFLYWEDIDLSQRLLALGGELAVVHGITATHSVRGTQRASGRQSRYCYHMCRNRLRFATFHLPLRDRVRWIRYAPAYMRRAVLGGWRAAFHHPWRALNALAGTVAGAGAVVASIGRQRQRRA
jgi:N-acetylglucosaminyl-diphospho-decaprenol L-rhamnosyltransferase